MAKKRWGKVKAVDVRDYDQAHHRSGGKLKVPRTPVERIMLSAKLMKMKSDFLKNQAERGS